ncbi:hypothetical protein MAPG_04860 [Magnaporthiopsis poae ATCC 64411]|uniref:Uncharacterized protein n=1 Tax=Magnaporthiopsis poae (strain ATCC 64411 / 73-15) TaxID=644358 RepID=A0A0C4DXV3_MAGP6|nr:hypothetical protein MAPG_04860 [Magnaporthiopsis poae ATCC 64411]
MYVMRRGVSAMLRYALHVSGDLAGILACMKREGRQYTRTHRGTRDPGDKDGLLRVPNDVEAVGWVVWSEGPPYGERHWDSCSAGGRLRADRRVALEMSGWMKAAEVWIAQWVYGHIPLEAVGKSAKETFEATPFWHSMASQLTLGLRKA